MPGIITSTAVRSGAASVAAPRSAQYMPVGLTERGPTVPTEVTSFSQFVDLFGDRVTYGFLYDDLQTFFREGGARALVKRVVGPAATLGTLTVNDGAGTPVPTLRFDAASAGAWSSRVSVEITAGTVGTVSVGVYLDGVIANRYSNLASVAAIVDALTRSPYVRGVSLGGALPAVKARTALSAGSDDRASVTASVLTGAAGLGAFTADYGTGAVAIPGYPASQVAGALIQHGVDYSRVEILHDDVTALPADVINTARGLLSASGDGAGIFYPWVQIPGPGAAPLTIPPTGYVAAMRSRAHVDEGEWRVPAGDLAKARFVSGLAGDPITNAVGQSLDDAHVSVIRQFGSDIQLYGYRSLSTNESVFRLLSTRDATSVVVEDLNALLRPRLFGSVDATGAYYLTVRTALIGYLDPKRSAGGLFPLLDGDGEQLDPGYSVVVDASINSAATLAANAVYAEVGLRWSPVAEFIYLKVTTVGITVALAA